MHFPKHHQQFEIRTYPLSEKNRLLKRRLVQEVGRQRHAGHMLCGCWIILQTRKHFTGCFIRYTSLVYASLKLPHAGGIQLLDAEMVGKTEIL